MSSPKKPVLQTIEKLIRERYNNAKAVFWAGSVSRGEGSDFSDLDLVIVFESVTHAYREALIYDNWPIDAFIHDRDTLKYFFNRLEKDDGRPALITMILNGREVLGNIDFIKNIKKLAQDAFSAGPATWEKSQIDKQRFLITDILDDIKFSKNRVEQMVSAARILELLMHFYFRAQKKWAASGKAMVGYLKEDNPELAVAFEQSIENVFQRGDATLLESIVKQILRPHGGLLWDGFRLDAPKSWKN